MELFAPYGDVANCSLPLERDTGRKRGFAFVEMTDPEAENRAIDGLQGAELMGRPLRINKAEPRAGGGGGGGGGAPPPGGGGGGGGGGEPPAAVAMAAAAVTPVVAKAVAMAAAVGAVTPVVAKVVATAVANGAPDPAAGKIAATRDHLGTQAVAMRSRPAVPGAGAAAARTSAGTTAAPRPEERRRARVVGTSRPRSSVAPLLQLASGGVQHLRSCPADPGVPGQGPSPGTGPTHPFHHMHQVPGDRPDPAP
jgi:RNA recognition motif-containing protein